MDDNENLSFFERFLFEAPGDDPPDAPAADTAADATGPPDMPAGDAGEPPDLGGDVGGDPPADEGSGDPDAPPDLGGDDSFDGAGGDNGSGDGTEDGEDPNAGLDDKVSDIMNVQLYQKFLSLLNNIGSELTMCKINNDILYTLSPDTMNLVPALKKLDENIRLYLQNAFIHENYSKNLLFFNKCLNLLKLLNDVFDKDVKKGVDSME